MQLIGAGMIKGQDSPAKWISILYRYGQSYVNGRLKPVGRGNGGFLFLIKLYQNEDIRQDDLAAMLKFDKTTVARALSRLEKDGFTIPISPIDYRRF